MSIHPSLSLSEKEKKQRSVLKRSERIKMMMEKGEWKKGDRIFGLPKIKTLKFKFKKEKAEKPSEAEVATVTQEAAPAEAETKEQPVKKESTEKAAKPTEKAAKPEKAKKAQEKK